MALRFCDSFDGYDSAHVLEKWTSIGPGASGNFAINTSTKRTGRASGEFTSIANCQKTVDNIVTWIIGGAFLWTGYGGGINLYNVNTFQIQWQLQNDGTIAVINSGGGTLGRTSPTDAISLNNFYYVEAQLPIGNGSIIIKINGQTVLNTSGAGGDGTSATADVCLVIGPAASGKMYVDDFYICDTNTPAPDNTFLGDVSIGVVVPISDAAVQWTPSTAGTHWSLVNEIPPDDDATYVQSTMVGAGPTGGPYDFYNFQPVTTTRAILGVQTNMFTRKTDEGNRAVSVIYTSATGTPNIVDTNGRYLGLNYIDYLNQFSSNPNNGGTWTPTDFNNLQWGIEVIV